MKKICNSNLDKFRIIDVNWSMLIDPLSAVMLVVVTSVSSLVHIYSIGYMSHDPHKPRFMAYLIIIYFCNVNAWLLQIILFNYFLDGKVLALFLFFNWFLV